MFFQKRKRLLTERSESEAQASDYLSAKLAKQAELTVVQRELKPKRNQTFAAAGKLVRAARQAKGWSQRQLKEKSGIDTTYLSKIENGQVEYVPRLHVLKKLSQTLGLNLSELRRAYGLEPVQEWTPSTVLLPDFLG